MILMFISILLCIHFSSSDQILTTNIGQDVTFSCIFENEYQFNEVSFMHQTTGDILSVGLELFVDQSLSNNHIQLIRFSSNRLDLKISSVNLNDSGLYTCMINDEKLSAFLLEIFNKSGELIFLEFVIFDFEKTNNNNIVEYICLVPPRFVSYSPLEGSILYPEGSSMNLSCRSFSIPSSNITWIYREKNKQSKRIHNGEDLYITYLKSSDSGSYECVASNGYDATISRSFYVTVQYPPRVRINQYIDNGNSPLQLFCQICSMPLSNIKWIENEKDITNDQHFLIKSELIYVENEECLITMLTIHESSHEKSLRYECRGENFLGQNSDHMDLFPKLVPKVRSEKEEISFLTLSNESSEMPNSSECFFRLPYLLFVLIVNVICSL